MLVSICMCTYKRASLKKTLDSVVSQKLPEGYTLEVVVVDNDAEESGRAACNAFAQHDTAVPVKYFTNSVRNLSEVRNSTMEHARGELLVFIDDDEWASDDQWIAKMIATMDKHQADVVFGRVIVHYPASSPDWIVAGDMFGKDSHAHESSQKKGATSNALMKALWVKEKDFRFDPYFGKSGGEDTDFFHRIYKAGGKLIYDAKASVEEEVESHRLNLEYIKKQNIRIGQTHYSYLWSQQSGIAYIKTGFFVLAQIGGYGLLTVLSLPFGKKRYLRWYVLFIRNIEKLKTAFSGKKNTVELYGNS